MLPDIKIVPRTCAFIATPRILAAAFGALTRFLVFAFINIWMVSRNLADYKEDNTLKVTVNMSPCCIKALIDHHNAKVHNTNPL